MRKSLYCIILIILTTGFIYPQDNNPIPYTTAEERLEGYKQRVELQKKSLLGNVELRSIGPTVMSGRVVDIDVSPYDPTHFYLAYASGGLWKTTNNGISFNPLFDNQASMTIGDIAVTRLLTEDCLLLKEIEDESEKGLNYVKYNLSIDSTVKNDYMNY